MATINWSELTFYGVSFVKCQLLLKKIQYLSIFCVCVWCDKLLFYPSFTYLRSMCVLGKRLLKDINIKNCSKEVDGILWNEFCVLNNNTKDRDYIRNPELFKSRELNWNCDPYFAGLTYDDWISTNPIKFNPPHAASNITIVQGIKGLSSGVFFENLKPSFLDVSLRSFSLLKI